MKIEQLTTFVTVAELGSVSKAAKQLSLSQAAVSHQILAMEAELRFDLFLHEGRKCQLSDAGAVFLDRVAPILGMYRSAVEDVRDYLGIESSTNELTVVYPPECNPNVCAKLAETYWATNPHMLVTFIGGESLQQALASVKDRVTDACICIESTAIHELDLAFWPIQNIPECCIVEGGSRLSELSEIRYQDLGGIHVNFMHRKGTFVAEDAVRSELARVEPSAILREPPTIGGAPMRISRKELEHVIITPRDCANTNSSTRKFIPLDCTPARFGVVTRDNPSQRTRDFIERLAQHYRAHPEEPVV